MLSKSKVRSLLPQGDSISDEQLEQLVSEMYTCAHLIMRLASGGTQRAATNQPESKRTSIKAKKSD